MNKREYCESRESIAYYSGLNGLEIKGIEYGIDDYIYCVSGAWGGAKAFHRCKIQYTRSGAAFFRVHGYRVPLDECIGMGGLIMGAVNYFTSDYITMGIEPYSACDLENDQDFMQVVHEQIKEYGGMVENCISDMIESYYEDDETNVSAILEKYSFDYFRITIKPGYYEGFTLDIENDFPDAFNGWEDKRAAQREITSLKKCLIECAGAGMVQCSPGWCTGYNDYRGTCKAIGAAVKVMRDEVNSIPTWAQYARANA